MLPIHQITLIFLVISSILLFTFWAKKERRKSLVPLILQFLSPVILFSFLVLFSPQLGAPILENIAPYLFFWSALSLTRLSNLAYPHYHGNISKYAIGYLVGTALFVIRFLSLNRTLSLPYFGEEVLSILLWVLIFSNTLFSFFRLIKLYWNSHTALYRNRILFWLLLNILYVFSIFNYLLKQPFLTIGFAYLTLVSIIYIQSRSELPDLFLLVRRSLSLLIETIAVYLLFTLALGFFLLLALNSTSIPISFILFGGGILFSLLIYPLVGKTRKFIRNRLWKTKRNYTSLLSNYSRNIASLSDLETLFSHLSGLLHQTFDIEDIQLLTAIDRGEYFEFQNNLNPLSSPLIIPKHSQILLYLQENKTPLFQYILDFGEIFADTPEEEKNAIRSLKGDVLVPILFQVEWLGLLIIGAKTSGDRFFEEEIIFLQTIADQTAVALKNTILYEDLLKRNRENERLNIELTMANKELARLDKAKTDFINIASHELRTPLTQILGFNDFLGEMLQSGMPPLSSLERMVVGIKKAAKRLEEIVSIMLDISKLETQIFEIHPSPVKPATIIRASAEKWRTALEERSLTLHIADLNDLPMIQADSQRMVQVFSELIQNAIKSTPDHREIFITGKTIHDSGSGKTFVQITVSDTGIGISPEDIEKIFEKFYRIGDVLLHSTGDTKFKGAGPGLGLTIAKGIVEAHQGRIWAESPGRDEKSLPGSHFHVLLPTIQSIVQNNAQENK